MQKIKIQGLILFSASLTALFQKGQKEPPVTHIGGEKQEMVKIGFSTPYMSDWVLLHTTETGLQHTNLLVREGWRYQIGWIFGKVPKGGGSFSIQKIILQNLETLNRAFEHEIVKKKSNFRVQGMFFWTIVLIL